MVDDGVRAAASSKQQVQQRVEGVHVNSDGERGFAVIFVSREIENRGLSFGF